MDILRLITNKHRDTENLHANFGVDPPREGEFLELNGKLFVVISVLRKMQKDAEGTVIQWNRTVTAKFYPEGEG